VLSRPWIRLGVDELIDALPASFDDDSASDAGIVFGPDGEVTVSEDFRRAEAAWLEGIASMARSGLPVIVEDVFLEGARSQERLRERFGGLDVLWVGVHCPPAVAAARERGRGDRVAGMAVRQSEAVHTGVDYTVEVDSSRLSPAECADAIATHVDQVD
jgi:chloramphenicol 3-O phosphotransferase